MAGNPLPFLNLRPAYEELRVELEEAIARTVRSGWYVLGREVEAFEREFASATEARFAVGVGNGLEAILLALKALDVGPGHEVIVPANTYIATWLAVTYTGARPVPVEPVPGRWTLDPDALSQALTPRTRAIVPVHLYGQPVDLDPILAFAREWGLRVVEDAAQSHGARYRGRRIGAHGDAVAWSFYPTKNLGCLGDGGAVTTDDDGIADRIRVLRNYGSRTRYENEVRGHNSRLDELQAAVLRVKLRHLDSWNLRRAAIAERYTGGLGSVRSLRLPQTCPDAPTVWHLFVIDHPERNALQAHLARLGIQTLIHYPVPPHRSGAYADAGHPEGSFPVTEEAARTHLSLPIGPHLSAEDASRVVEAVRSFGRG